MKELLLFLILILSACSPAQSKDVPDMADLNGWVYARGPWAWAEENCDGPAYLALDPPIPGQYYRDDEWLFVVDPLDSTPWDMRSLLDLDGKCGNLGVQIGHPRRWYKITARLTNPLHHTR